MWLILISAILGCAEHLFGLLGLVGLILGYLAIVFMSDKTETISNKTNLDLLK